MGGRNRVLCLAARFPGRVFTRCVRAGRGLIQQRFQQGYNMRGNQGGQQGHNNQGQGA